MSSASSVAVVAQREVWANAGGLTQLLEGVLSAAHQQQHSSCSSGATSAPPHGLKLLCRNIFTLLGFAGFPDILQCFHSRCYWSFLQNLCPWGQRSGVKMAWVKKQTLRIFPLFYAMCISHLH